MAEETVVTADTPRAVLVAQSDDAYDRAIATPLDHPADRLVAFTEVLVAEAKLDRYDRENPFEVAGLVWNEFEGLDED